MSDSKPKKKKNMAKEKVSSCSLSSNCSWSSSDNRENDMMTLKAIREYLSDRVELAHQLFESVKVEKIKMMLPQILKNIDMIELEELCAHELCGMSKSRILSILSGTPMTISSDTSEANDSGPSLEIISDTETWISDSEQQSYSTPYNQDGLKFNRKMKFKETNNACVKQKSRAKMQTSNPSRNKSILMKVKKEKDKEQVKNQEGESLLDLLELEMRARAIKALIRKEEDIVSTLECEQKSITNLNISKEDVSTITALSTAAVVNCDLLLNKSNMIVNSFDHKSVGVDEDQDVVMLVNPTPMINLLSSDSESDNHNKHMRKQFENEHFSSQFINRVIDNEREISVEKMLQPILKIISCNSSEGNSVKESDDRSSNTRTVNNFDKIPMDVHSKNVSCVMKKLQIKNIDKNTTNRANINCGIIKVENQNGEALVSIDDNKLVDEEIIDLDDYPDDMEDIDDYEHISFQNEKSTDDNVMTNNAYVKSENIVLNSAETWASRYYQTDNVQNVIKESKIQSEIRKRLRERQKLSKLNTYSKNTYNSCIKSDKEAEQVINDSIKLTGSVQEYLALEGTTTTTVV